MHTRREPRSWDAGQLGLLVLYVLGHLHVADSGAVP